jgi:hypothetical protein
MIRAAKKMSSADDAADSAAAAASITNYLFGKFDLSCSSLSNRLRVIAPSGNSIQQGRNPAHSTPPKYHT